MQLGEGSLSQKEIEALLDALPIQITFADKDDNLKYYNKPHIEIFHRSKDIINTKVQKCHSKKSIHLVNKILSDFKTKKKDVAEFWVHKNGHLIHNQYIAVRDKSDEYLGIMEITQDVTYIKRNINEVTNKETAKY